MSELKSGCVAQLNSTQTSRHWLVLMGKHFRKYSDFRCWNSRAGLGSNQRDRLRLLDPDLRSPELLLSLLEDRRSRLSLRSLLSRDLDLDLDLDLLLSLLSLRDLLYLSREPLRLRLKYFNISRSSTTTGIAALQPSPVVSISVVVTSSTSSAGSPGVDGDPQVPPVVGPAVEGIHGVLGWRD